jgi:hypothetical protein
MQLTFIGIYINQILSLFRGEPEEPDLDTLFDEDIEWFMLRAPSTDRDTYLQYRDNLLGAIKKGYSGQAVKDELLVRLEGLQLSDKQAAMGSSKTQPAPGPPRGNQLRGSQQPSNPPAPRPSKDKQPVSPPPPRRTPLDQPWFTIASEPKPQQQPTRPQQPQPQLQPPEGMNLGQKLNWYAKQGMEMPEPKRKGKAPAYGPNAPRHAGEPRNIILVQRDNTASRVAQASEEERSNTSASDARVTASLAAANQRIKYSGHPTPLLNKSIHAVIAITKSTKLYAKHAQRFGRDNLE